jgi:hypothetical protein
MLTERGLGDELLVVAVKGTQPFGGMSMFAEGSMSEC